MTTADEPAWQIAWRDGLSVGNARIDSDHKELIQRVNDLNASLVAQAGQDEVLRRMQRLLETATVHFASEERLLHDRGFPQLEKHRRKHETLTADFQRAMDNFAKAVPGLAWLAKGLVISQALMEHLAKDDMIYRDFLRSDGD